MKGIQKHHLLLCFFFTLFLSSNLLFPQAAISGYTIFTRMTEIELPPNLIYRGSNPTHTFFEFWCTLEIINPSGKNLYIYTPSTCLVFFHGSLSFENEQYEGFVWGPHLCGSSFTNHSIEPGINEGTLKFELSVNDTLEALPNGNFSVRIFFDDYLHEHSYKHFPSTIAVNGSDVQITHTGANETFVFPTETLPTPTSTLPLSIILPFFLGVLTLLLKRKHSVVS